jgi:hypothetical protein
MSRCAQAVPAVQEHDADGDPESLLSAVKPAHRKRK